MKTNETQSPVQTAAVPEINNSSVRTFASILSHSLHTGASSEMTLYWILWELANRGEISDAILEMFHPSLSHNGAKTLKDALVEAQARFGFILELLPHASDRLESIKDAAKCGESNARAALAFPSA